MNQSEREYEIQSQISDLEAELAELRECDSWMRTGETVRVPEPFKPAFAAAQKTVREFFSRSRQDPTKATIEISGERYVLMRASSLSVDFLNTIRSLYADYEDEHALAIGRNILFDMSHVIGMEDARNFHRKMGVTDPIAKMAAGPVHFAYSGWAFVDVSEESTPHPDENFFLKYDHPFSFEADSWEKADQQSESPVCIMSAGYSSGWCEESFGVALTAVEITCKAAGDDACTFIMAPPHKISGHVDRYLPNRRSKKGSLPIPSFFERKRVSEEMETARLKAEESDRMKSAFLANMSHEIRTPMNGVIGMTNLVLESKLTKSQREFLVAARESAESLMTIINEILDFSKIDAGAMTLERKPFTFRNLIKELMKPLELHGQMIGLKVSWEIASDVPDDLIGDAGRLRQVIVNLVGNAIKFTEDGSVRLTVSVSDEESPVDRTRLFFEVVDTGIGIPPEKLAQVFDAFTQVDMSTTRRFGGTGLGLTISSELVKLMKGHIWCTNNEQAGSTFHFIAEFGLAEESSNGSQENRNGSMVDERQQTDIDAEFDQSLNILLAEDGIVNQKVATALLNRWGHSVTIANNGMEAVSLWQESPDSFDLILMDILMPELDGLEATVAIRNLEKDTGNRIPILAVTAQAMKGDRDACLNAGMDGYISKPISKDELRKMINTVFTS